MSSLPALRLLICIPLAGCSGLANSTGLNGNGFRLDGSYVPYPVELAGDCPQLTSSMRLQIGLISGADERAKKEQLTTPVTLVAAAGRAFDVPQMGLVSIKNARKAHTLLVTLRETARSKGCSLDGLPEITGAENTLALFPNRSS